MCRQLGETSAASPLRVGFFDFLSAVFVTVILITSAAVPMLDVALGILGRRLCEGMLQVSVVIRVKLSVSLFANFAYRLFCAGCLSAVVVCDLTVYFIENKVPVTSEGR